jgi:hypothetical protein
MASKFDAFWQLQWPQTFGDLQTLIGFLVFTGCSLSGMKSESSPSTRYITEHTETRCNGHSRRRSSDEWRIEQIKGTSRDPG